MVDSPRPPRTYRIFPRAEADLASAFDYYEVRQPGLGDAFLRAVRATLASLARYPESHPRVRGQVRRALVRRFPFGIFFDAEETEVRVLAVLHTRRDPASWPRSGAD